MKENKKRVIETIILGVIALILCVLIGIVFKKNQAESANAMSDEEGKLVAILEKIDGVGDAEVMIGASEDGQKRVVVVCEGADKISVLIDVREATATALGIDEKFVKIYLKNK
jgi:type III secretory pathway lipoprotein EscJ